MEKHFCEYLNEVNGYKGFNVEISYGDSFWFLHYKSIASELDVRSGEAAFVGEELSNVKLMVKFCPFCGCVLSGDYR